MSHHQQSFLKAPKKRILQASDSKSGTIASRVDLIVKGQGVVSFTKPEHNSFDFFLQEPTKQHGFKFIVTGKSVTLYEGIKGDWQERERKENIIALEKDCPFWFSLDYSNKCLRFGTGEIRLETTLFSYDYTQQSAKSDPYSWVHKIQEATFSPTQEKVVVWRDPVVVPTPLFVVSPDVITMEDVAKGEKTVPVNLSKGCQVLYQNVAGAKFQIDTPDFPDFSKAIQASIDDENGWCAKKLKEKADEFGKPNPDETYLRITLGKNQGDSPGVPYVMEIWPSGHYSPIHNHGNASAIIRVLHGEVNVELFRRLSMKEQKPFAQQVFQKEDITWISPGLNQIHRLTNKNSDKVCVTIQCYMYEESNHVHYEYFDYLGDDKIKQFTPNSDMDFLKFKAKMKEEWGQRTTKK